jgi:hypothetical protein
MAVRRDFELRILPFRDVRYKRKEANAQDEDEERR